LNLDKSIDKLNERLSKLWPEESGNGHGNDEDIKNAIMDAAERWWYQECKEEWFFHKSSWYMRKVNGYDGKGCNPQTRCIPECPYYPDEGKLSLSPGFYEEFVSEPWRYPTFQDFLKRWIWEQKEEVS
jgi:hypothetical protein